MDFKTTPLHHQAVEFDKTKRWKNFARLWEMGLGKTKTTIDEAAYLWAEHKIKSLLVVAPNNVHTAWHLDELPKHCPVRFKSFLWNPKKQKNKSFDKEWRLFMTRAQHEDCDYMPVFVVSHDAIMVEKCRKMIKQFVTEFDTFCAVDESHAFKTPGAKRTIRMRSLAKYMAGRRILTGTPITNSPFDIYSQMCLLNPDFWKEYGFETYAEFKAYFGILVTHKLKEGGREWEQCVGYRNLERLHEIVDEHASRLLTDDVVDLPEMRFQRRYFDMSADQIRMYDELEKEFMTYLDGEIITAGLAIVRMQRLQQITSGYIPLDNGDDGEPAKLICDPNPRLKCLAQTLDDIPHQSIIWAKYQRDIELIMDMLSDRKESFVDFYGATKDKDKNKALFLDGKAKYFVATEAAAGTGLTLNCAKSSIYYNTTYKLHHRLQSQKRNHRIGQDVSINIIDLIAAGTIDSKIIKRLVEKKDLSDAVTGDDFKAWL